MNKNSIPMGQVEILDTATDHPGTDGLSLLPGFIRFYQQAQQIQAEPGQLYAMIDDDLHSLDISLRDDIPAQLAKKYQR